MRDRYAAAATSVEQGRVACCGPSNVAEAAQSCGCGTGVPDACGGDAFGSALYEIADRGSLPEAAKLASLGCGNPTAVAELHEGETVLDLGSGGGIDVLLSARRVGPTRQGVWRRHDRRDARGGPPKPAGGGRRGMSSS